MEPHSNVTFIRLAALFFILAAVPARGQAPVISSFDANGQLVCTNLQPGSTASVEWASSPLGPWTNSWEALGTLTVDANGTITASVPMFYRVRGEPAAPTGMVLIPSGSFTMGDTFYEGYEYPIELPLHTVQVCAFYIDTKEVTKALWDEVKNWAVTNGYAFDKAGLGKAANHPVHSVSWYDALKWCNARSEREGRVPAYYANATQTAVYRTGRVNGANSWVKWNSGYRLPTEAEWEKAARGGVDRQRFPWGDTISWSEANYLSEPWGYTYDVSPATGPNPTFLTGDIPYTSPVGWFAPNGYGLYDMAGNVQEWCWDRLDPDVDRGADYSSSDQIDPRGSTSGSARLARGGGWGWGNTAKSCRVAARMLLTPTDGFINLGFRTVLPQVQP